MDKKLADRENHLADKLEKLAEMHRKMARGEIKNGSKEMIESATIACMVIRLLVEDYI